MQKCSNIAHPPHFFELKIRAHALTYLRSAMVFLFAFLLVIKQYLVNQG